VLEDADFRGSFNLLFLSEEIMRYFQLKQSSSWLPVNPVKVIGERGLCSSM